MRSSLVCAAALAALTLTAPAEAQSRRGRADRAPKVGSVAPDFELARLGPDGKATTEKVKLSSFKGKKPVALVFGSYT